MPGVQVCDEGSTIGLFQTGTSISGDGPFVHRFQAGAWEMSRRHFTVSTGPSAEVSETEGVCPVWAGTEQTSAGGIR